MDPANETALDRLNQLALSNEQAAVDITALHSALVAMRGHVDTLTTQLAGLRDIQTANADQIAQVAHRLTALDRLAPLEERLTAAQAAGERTSERVEALAGDVARLGRVESGLGQVRSELADQLKQLEDRGRAAGAEQERRHASLAAETAVALSQLRDSLLTKDAANERFIAQDRARQETFDALGRLTARVEALGGERTALEDVTRRHESAVAVRVDGLNKRVDDLHELHQSWQARIENQERTVSEVRAIGAGVERTAEAIRDGERVMAEAARVFEARVESSLDAFRQEATEEWRQHLAQHDAARVQAERERAQRAADRQAAQDELFSGFEARLQSLQTALNDGLDRRGEETLVLYQQLAEAFAAIRDAFVGGARIFEAPLPAEAQPAMLAERRNALRRAMRVRREGAGDER
ncbi:MAG: hypothetical protein IT332_09280 [Ardenticatenales bacterium]|nr:hypothetical protein [Ardenticatenales bacterium]